MIIPEIVEQTAFIVRDLLLPVVSMFAAIISVLFAVRRSIMKAPAPPPVRPPSPPSNGDQSNGVESINGRDLLIDSSKFDEYHTQTLSQSRTSFWFSIIFASVGFMAIASSIFINTGGSTIGVVSGVITEAVSALFFYQSNKASKLMSDFFDSLRSDRKVYQSLQLCAQIENTDLRDNLRLSLALYFSGLTNPHDLTKELLKTPPEA